MWIGHHQLIETLGKDRLEHIIKGSNEEHLSGLSNKRSFTLYSSQQHSVYALSLMCIFGDFQTIYMFWLFRLSHAQDNNFAGGENLQKYTKFQAFLGLEKIS